MKRMAVSECFADHVRWSGCMLLAHVGQKYRSALLYEASLADVEDVVQKQLQRRVAASISDKQLVGRADLELLVEQHLAQRTT
eukprot:1428897-Amphidinium_carterae.1